MEEKIYFQKIGVNKTLPIIGSVCLYPIASPGTRTLSAH